MSFFNDRKKISKSSFIKNNDLARKKAIELGYSGLLDLNTNGSEDHKKIVRGILNK